MNPKHAKVAWIYFIGVIIIVIGIYIFAFYPLLDFYGITGFILSFIIMLAGLLVTGIGAIHGKRKLREMIIAEYEEGPASTYPATGEDPKTGAQPTEPQPIETQSPEETSPQTTETSQMPVKEAATPEPAEQIPKTEETESDYEPEAQRVIKVLLCPKCGAENKERNVFCYHCGKKLRMKSFKHSK